MKKKWIFALALLVAAAVMLLPLYANDFEVEQWQVYLFNNSNCYEVLCLYGGIEACPIPCP